jgi:hypothetical protein
MTTTNRTHRKVIANRIAYAARAAGLTNAQLGALVQLGESGVSRRLAGETGWTAEDLAIIAPAIGLDIPAWLNPNGDHQ